MLVKANARRHDAGMLIRDARLQRFIDLTEGAILARVDTCKEARPAARRIFSALREKHGEHARPCAKTLSMGRELVGALKIANKEPELVAKLALAMTDLVPTLAWYRRKPDPSHAPNFANGHANAIVVGEGGIEIRSDVLIGISLMAPHVRYPDHIHPPEEVYISLAGGAWWKEGGEWQEPGPGGLIYNEPGVMHAMRAGQEPLLAVWCLWTDTSST